MKLQGRVFKERLDRLKTNVTLLQKVLRHGQNIVNKHILVTKYDTYTLVL